METAGPVLERLFDDALKEERARKASREARAVFVITSSGAFTTLLLAVGGFATGSSSLDLSVWARGFLISAVLLFGAAAVLCLKVNQPTKYQEMSISGLQKLVERSGYWKAHPMVGLRTSALSRLEILSGFRSVNEQKADILTWAFAVEVVAVVCVALSVVVVLMG